MLPIAMVAPVRILIADDRPISRAGLRWLIETQPGLQIVGETSNDSEATVLVRERQADVLLLHFPTDTARALDTLRQIAASDTVVRTIILAERLESPDVAAALRLGVKGVVLNECAAEMLFKSIHSVAAGAHWIDGDEVPDAAASLRRLEAQRRQRRGFGLTQRELAIVRAVVAGHTNQEIAHSCSITENTVKSHLTHIFNKLGASNRVELALFAAHHRLLDGM
jgi:DNA-binding NarL/FixJ family response regulator